VKRSLLLENIRTVGGSRHTNLIRKCTTRVLIEVPLSPVTCDIRYNGAKLIEGHAAASQIRCDCSVQTIEFSNAFV
jgi:hypothetical protein